MKYKQEEGQKFAMETNQKKREKIIGILFDKENSAPLVLKNDRGTTLEFECVYAVREDGETYCILLPLAAVEGKDDTAAFAFRVGEDGALRAVNNRTAAKIFEKYYKTRQKKCGRHDDGTR